MVRKIKSKDKKKTNKNPKITIPKKDIKEVIRMQRMEARGDMLEEFLMSFASMLRIKKKYGKKVITDHIRWLMEHMSDYKMGIYFDKSDMRAMLKEECDIEIDKLINEEAEKHFLRIKEFEKKHA